MTSGSLEKGPHTTLHPPLSTCDTAFAATKPTSHDAEIVSVGATGEGCTSRLGEAQNRSSRDGRYTVSDSEPSKDLCSVSQIG